MSSILIGRLQALKRPTVDLWRTIDPNMIGGVDGDELAVGLLTLGVPFSRSELEGAIEVMDRDGAGEVTAVDFSRSMRHHKLDPGTDPSALISPRGRWQPEDWYAPPTAASPGGLAATASVKTYRSVVSDEWVLFLNPGERIRALRTLQRLVARIAKLDFGFRRMARALHKLRLFRLNQRGRIQRLVDHRSHLEAMALLATFRSLATGVVSGQSERKLQCTRLCFCASGALQRVIVWTFHFLSDCTALAAARPSRSLQQQQQQQRQQRAGEAGVPPAAVLPAAASSSSSSSSEEAPPPGFPFPSTTATAARVTDSTAHNTVEPCRREEGHAEPTRAANGPSPERLPREPYTMILHIVGGESDVDRARVAGHAVRTLTHLSACHAGAAAGTAGTAGTGLIRLSCRTLKEDLALKSCLLQAVERSVVMRRAAFSHLVAVREAWLATRYRGEESDRGRVLAAAVALGRAWTRGVCLELLREWAGHTGAAKARAYRALDLLNYYSRSQQYGRRTRLGFMAWQMAGNQAWFKVKAAVSRLGVALNFGLAAAGFRQWLAVLERQREVARRVLDKLLKSCLESFRADGCRAGWASWALWHGHAGHRLRQALTAAEVQIGRRLQASGLASLKAAAASFTAGKRRLYLRLSLLALSGARVMHGVGWACWGASVRHWRHCAAVALSQVAGAARVKREMAVLLNDRYRALVSTVFTEEVARGVAYQPATNDWGLLLPTGALAATATATDAVDARAAQSEAAVRTQERLRALRYLSSATTGTVRAMESTAVREAFDRLVSVSERAAGHRARLGRFAAWAAASGARCGMHAIYAAWMVRRLSTMQEELTGAKMARDAAREQAMKLMKQPT